MKQNTQTVYEVDTLNLLPPDGIILKREESGFLSLEYDSKRYDRVSLTRLIPYIDEDKYISVSYNNEENEWKEIGVIKDINELPEGQRAIVAEFLSFRYYIPIITKINKITDNQLGYLLVESETTAGE